MIHHIVFFNMAVEAEDKTGSENAEELVSQLKALKGKIDVLQSIEVGLDFSDSPSSFDVGLYTTFNTREDLETYRIHPDHQMVVDFVKRTTSDRKVVDFET